MIFIYLLICLVIAGFFAGMETGLLSANRMLIQARRSEGVLSARAAEFLLSKPERLLGTTLIGHNVANVTAAVLVTNHLESLHLTRFTWLAILAMTFVFLVFDDFIPKSYLRQHANTIAARLSPLLLVFYFVFLPLYLILNTIVKALLIFTGTHKAKREELTTRRDLRFMVNLTGKEAGLPTEDQRIIEDILHFRDQIAQEVMIPFHKLPVLTVGNSIVDVVRTSMESGQRFLPVSRHRTDNMIGYIDTSDLLVSDVSNIEEVMQKADFYPETRRLPDLLLDMNRKEEEVVFLVDEYGAIAGMITPNQIVADVVHYTPENGSFHGEIKRISQTRFRVNGEADLEDLSHELGISLTPSINSTVGGYLSERIGRIPAVGEVYEEAGCRFIVTARTDRSILRIDVERIRRSDGDVTGAEDSGAEDSENLDEAVES